MSQAPRFKQVTPGEGKVVRLFGVRFDYKVESEPRDIPHAMRNANDAPAKVVEMLAPSGLESYFEELARSSSGTIRRTSATRWPSATASPSRTTGSKSSSAPMASRWSDARARQVKSVSARPGAQRQ
jgi:hypothetical protein